MKRWAMAIVAAAMCACSETDDSLPFSGIGSVENADTVCAIHFYDYTLLLSEPIDVPDGSRVVFRCRANHISGDPENVYSARITYVSDDITQPIERGSAYGAPETYCLPNDMHITRDWLRRDFFNITASYPTKPDNNDVLRLVTDNTVPATDSTLTLWLRHYQSSADSCHMFSTSSISVPLNHLQNKAHDRISITVKRLGMYNDTIVTQYVYGYR